MATKAPNKGRGSIAVDSKGNQRIVVDLPSHVKQEFAVLAIRRNMTQRALIADLIMRAVAGK